MCEAVVVVKALMGPTPVQHHGSSYTLNGLDGQPKPVQRPHVPILIAGGGKELLEFAAREADVVAVNTRHRHGVVGTGDELAESTLRRRVELVRSSARERWPTLELNLLLKNVVVTDDRTSAAAEIGARLHLSREEALASPYLLMGSAEEMADQILDTRERFGFSYFTVFQHDLDAFGPVIDRLRR
jgi:probable F420-dependent oxidoreductase